MMNKICHSYATGPKTAVNVEADRVPLFLPNPAFPTAVW
jgi:hypothetical protein